MPIIKRMYLLTTNVAEQFRAAENELNILNVHVTLLIMKVILYKSKI